MNPDARGSIRRSFSGAGSGSAAARKRLCQPNTCELSAFACRHSRRPGPCGADSPANRTLAFGSVGGRAKIASIFQLNCVINATVSAVSRSSIVAMISVNVCFYVKMSTCMRPLTGCGASSRVLVSCVFFAQQLVENRSNSLWEGAFFVAPGGSSANV